MSLIYDSFGRTITTVDSSGNTAATTYDANGRVATTNDGITTTTYAYNGTDANGDSEYRGLVTSKTVASAIMNGTTMSDAVFKAAYDSDGSLSNQLLPNGVTQNFTSNPTGQLTDMNYVAASQSDAVASFNRVYDSSGQVVADNGVSKTATYSYDYAGRLISSEQTVDGTCQVHNYTFDKDSNRTNLQTLTNDDGSCPVDAASATTVTNSPSHTFDAGDRMFLNGAGIASNYVYDDLGNTTTLPNVDTTNTAGDVTLAYQSDSQVKSISQAGIVKTFTQDPLGRNVATVETATGSPTVTSVNYFDDSSDSPAWSVDSGLKWTRNISDLAGGLSVISSGTASSTAAASTKTLTSSSVQLTDMHGDAVATMETTTGANTPTSTSAFDEYGAVISSPTTIPATYGWLGSQQRATTNAGLSLMGVRLYNPTTGRFLQTDPVPGGSPNAYAYPTDPIMGFDLDGKSWWKKLKHAFSKGRKYIYAHKREIAKIGQLAAEIACVLPSVLGCAIASGISAGLTFWGDDERLTRENAADLLLSIVSIRTSVLLDSVELTSKLSSKIGINLFFQTPGLILHHLSKRGD